MPRISIISPPTQLPVSSWKSPEKPPILKLLEQQVDEYLESCEEVHKEVEELEVVVMLTVGVPDSPGVSKPVPSEQGAENAPQARASVPPLLASLTRKRKRESSANQRESILRSLSLQLEPVTPPKKRVHVDSSPNSFSLIPVSVSSLHRLAFSSPQAASTPNSKSFQDSSEEPDCFFQGGSYQRYCEGDSVEDTDEDDPRFSDSVCGTLWLQ
ncbi:hypothetical protein VNI00_004700 [Paramarasmius palmivorus]|uniref:Uncharacterized protein n=1 Tax=Paramarasmius palmivorus TaxID=297713 RepID=A0AAW0DIJ2_9AGAR